MGGLTAGNGIDGLIAGDGINLGLLKAGNGIGGLIAGDGTDVGILKSGFRFHCLYGVGGNLNKGDRIDVGMCPRPDKKLGVRHMAVLREFLGTKVGLGELPGCQLPAGRSACPGN
jgi:hypothetical protein